MKQDKTIVNCTYQDAPEHFFPGHPETPRRLADLRGWLDDPPYPEIQWLDFSPATEAEVALVHSRSLLSALAAECEQGSHRFEPAPSYVTEDSLRAAFGAAGATLALSRRIIADGHGRGFAIVRPPGHHADSETSMGFCLLNNIAIAAADAVASGLSRVAIFDFDAHHGNGTEAIFYETPEVAYCSTHESGMYPGTGVTTSSPHAPGRIINIPVPPFSGDSAFQIVLDEIVRPWLAAFQPEMLFVSAGYDCHFSDPLTSLSLDTTGIYSLSKQLVELADAYCDGKILFVLEGGYDPLALKDNLQASLAALSGNTNYPDHYGKGPDVNVNIKSELEQLRKAHKIQE
ncbi:histone deacetylase [bacterium]|nr:histone deacetylase [bacterium]